MRSGLSRRRYSVTRRWPPWDTKVSAPFKMRIPAQIPTANGDRSLMGQRLPKCGPKVIRPFLFPQWNRCSTRSCGVRCARRRSTGCELCDTIPDSLTRPSIPGRGAGNEHLESHQQRAVAHTADRGSDPGSGACIWAPAAIKTAGDAARFDESRVLHRGLSGLGAEGTVGIADGPGSEERAFSEASTAPP